MPTWSGTRVKLEKEYLAESLKGRIQYFATSYSRCPDHYGRAAVRLDGKEVLKSSHYEEWMKEEGIRNAEQMESELSWLQFFYRLRLDAENIKFE